MLRKPFITYFIFLAVWATAFTGCNNKENNNVAKKADKTTTTASTNIDDSLRSHLQHFVNKPRVKGKFAMYVYDLTAGKPVFGYNENQCLPSASCLKLLTGTAGMHLLGCNYLYRSALYKMGSIANGVLNGNAVFKGGLDPQLDEKTMEMFAGKLRGQGVKQINGKLIIDLLLHQPVKSEQHWYPWDLSFSSYGTLYKGDDKVKQQLKQAFARKGIHLVDSQLVMGSVPRNARKVFCFGRSVQFVIKRMWKNSSNTQATSLLYTIGHAANPKAEPTQAGVAYLKQFLRKEIGINNPQVVIHDGCGLCTYNHLSPVVLTSILKYGYRHPDIYKSMQRQLSIAGVDGTLKKWSDADMKGKIKGKTGTLSHPYGISSVAGFCKGANGHLLAFALMDSEMSVLDAHVLQKKVCKLLVSAPEKNKGRN